MNTYNTLKKETGFRKLGKEELFDTYGGSMYKGPILPHIWLQFFIERLRSKED